MDCKSLRTDSQHRQAAILLADSFHRKHPLWRILPPDPKDSEAMFLYRVREAAKADLAWGFFVDGELVAVALFYPLQDYLKQNPPKSTNSRLFDLLAPHIKEIDEAVIKAADPSKRTYYSDYFGVQPESISKGYGAEAYLKAFQMVRTRTDIDDVFMRQSNPVNKHLAQSMGFRQIKQVPLTAPELKGHKLFMVYIPSVIRESSSPKAKL